MEGSSSRSNLKRSLLEDDDSNKRNAKKRVRFPKGKKVVERGNAEDDTGPIDVTDPRLAAKERAKRRNQITAELLSEDHGGFTNDTLAAEVKYEDNENFVDDGIQIEPFNLNKEREEGYFDEQGNFVEYIADKEIKDAWLDNVEIEPKYAGKISAVASEEEDAQELSSAEIGKMKRRIAYVLESGETVLQALRKLKGSGDRKSKMTAQTKNVFDQLTEDAMKLMENGEFNVYHEKKEVFEREAEGYEKLARTRGEGTSFDTSEENSIHNGEKDIFTNGMDSSVGSLAFPTTATGISNSYRPTEETSGNGPDAFNMFAEDDEHAGSKPSNETDSMLGHNLNAGSQLPNDSERGSLENDYIYDESSGYYYSSCLDYYYDPSTGLYCSAASRQWYLFNEETGTYDEVNELASEGS